MSTSEHNPLQPQTPLSRFHLPFPIGEHYQQIADRQQSYASTKPETVDLLMRLPNELSSQVWSFLPPAALDAARCTSQAWRAKIMSDNWTLTSVLEPETFLARRSSGPEPPGKLNRRLLKKLDAESTLPATFTGRLGDCSWKSRFRERTIHFCIPPPCNHHHHKARPHTATITSAALNDTGTFLALMVSNTTDNYPFPYRTSFLVIYRLGLAPVCVGAAEHSRVRGALSYQKIRCSTSEYRKPQSWILSICVGEVETIFQAKSRQSFQSGDDAFVLEQFGSEIELSRLPLTPSWTRKSTPLERSPVSEAWEFLAYLPTEMSPNTASILSNLHQGPEYAVAKLTVTGDVFVLRLAYIDRTTRPSLSHRPQGTVAFLAPPRGGLVFRNIAVLATLNRERECMVGIIWQERSLKLFRSELYIYTVASRNPIGPDQIGAPAIFMPITPFLDSSGEFKPCVDVQGKRITSLEPRFGGVHQASPLRDLPRNNAVSRSWSDEDALGGLRFVNHGDTHVSPAVSPSQAVLVWGSSHVDPDVKLRIFDLSFGDPARLRTIQRLAGLGGGRGKAYRSIHCACALHDEGIRVTLPDTWCKAASYGLRITPPLFASSPKSPSWLKPWKSTKPPPPTIEPAKGLVEIHDPPGRQAALEREEEYRKDKIRWMKKIGLTNAQIETEWSGAVWTDRGRISKPEGWRAL